MKVLLVYPNIMGVHKIILGLSYISACLRKAGHQVSILDTTFGITADEVIQSGKNIDLVGVAVMTLQLEQAKWISRLLKDAYSVPIVWGGNHPTVRPAECINYEFVDMVCVGEGEEAMVELLDRLDSGKDVTGIRNIWVKQNGSVYPNSIRPLIQDLDALPWPDRDAFDRRHLCIDSGSIISASRGCPYGCGYCINDNLKRLEAGMGRYSRPRSVDSVLAEMEMMREKYGVKFFEFADETFTIRRKWVLEFCDKYKRKLGFPFVFQTRCDAVQYDVLKAIREAGCDELSFGIETGNEKFRNEVLARRMSDETIFQAFRMARSLGFRVHAFNMVGLPYETEDLIVDTVKMNKRLKPIKQKVSIFYPFPGTRLGDLCESKGWIVQRGSQLTSFYYDTVLSMPQLDRMTILTYHRFFPIYLELPVSFFPALTPAFKLFLRIAYYIQERTGSRFLREFLNNLYWLTSALTDRKIRKRLLVLAPGRIRKLVKERGKLAAPA